MSLKIMVQGTASGVGKTVLTTALCRIFNQDGYKTVPFKSQNMTPVYHTLPDGRRIAKSQALAARACNLEPSADMNPILLIIGHEGTEVILGGESKGIMASSEYRSYKKHAFETALKSFRGLEEEADIVVIEGAGSPVELNLDKFDVVNMGLAKEVNAPVILVSDIIRGGVFASLYGTVSLLAQDERRLVKGIAVNKFKGNLEHFGQGRDILKNLCGVPVIGVVPYIDVGLEDEDSLSEGPVKNNVLDLDGELDRLADHFRSSLDMREIYKIMEGMVNG